MAEDASGVFRISRRKLVQRAHETIAEVEKAASDYEKAWDKYRADLKAYMLANLDICTTECDTFYRGARLSFELSNAQLEAAGLTQPKDTRSAKHVDIEGIRKELRSLELMEGEHVPQKYADKILKLLP